VCDAPLAFMDARTFRREHERPFRVHTGAGPPAVWGGDTAAGNTAGGVGNTAAGNTAGGHILHAALVHHPRQRWWYYSFQTEREVLVLTQHTRDRAFANPYTPFANPNCPPGSRRHASVELRGWAVW